MSTNQCNCESLHHVDALFREPRAQRRSHLRLWARLGGEMALWSRVSGFGASPWRVHRRACYQRSAQDKQSTAPPLVWECPAAPPWRPAHHCKGRLCRLSHCREWLDLIPHQQWLVKIHGAEPRVRRKSKSAQQEFGDSRQLTEQLCF